MVQVDGVNEKTTLKDSSEVLSCSNKPETSTSPTLSKELTWAPQFKTAFHVLLCARFLGVLFSHITDCDEVFNYWEPTHYLQYGYGLQTWEYSPAYAIRSWAYIVPHFAIAKVGQFLFSSKVCLLYFMMTEIF
jgi:alpha-1,2-mannosyltransferase